MSEQSSDREPGSRGLEAFGCAVIGFGGGSVFGPLYAILFAFIGAAVAPLLFKWFYKD